MVHRSTRSTSTRLPIVLVVICALSLATRVNHKPPRLSEAEPSNKNATNRMNDDYSSHKATVGLSVKENEFMNDYHICRPKEYMEYVCQGEAYEEFADKLGALVHAKTILSHANNNDDNNNKSSHQQWGRREFPFPAHSTILALGNSHTRQLTEIFPCQYDSLRMVDVELKVEVEVEVEVESGTNRSSAEDLANKKKSRGSFYIAEFPNNSTMYIITNHALFYSPNWITYVEEMIGRPLALVDAMIVGKINDFADAYKTSFMELMLTKTSKLEDADFRSIAPPTLEDIAQVYPGPIVAHSMFADWGSKSNNWMHFLLMEMVSNLRQTQKRTNLRLIHGRQYIPELGECGTNHWQEVGTCEDNRYKHRCIGSRGGHPDLVAWDVVEALNSLLLVA